MKRGRDKFNRYKRLISLLIKLNAILPESVNNFLLVVFRNLSGSLGLLVRYIIVKNIAQECGDNVSIHPGCYLFNLSNVTLENNISIHPMCYINGSGGIHIGNNVSIAHGVTIMSESHVFVDINIPIKDQGVNYRKVTIEEDVWIGAKAVIMYGVTISKGSVIGASSVVNKSTDPFSVNVGNPVRKVKYR